MEEDEDEEEYAEYGANGASEQVPQSDDLRVERMDISSEDGECVAMTASRRVSLGLYAD